MRIIVQDYKHLKLRQDALWLSVSTLVTVMIWIAYSVYLSYAKTTVDKEIEKLATKMNPQLDLETLGNLNTRYRPKDGFQVKIIETEQN